MDETLKLALAVQSNPGVYALLLGSGVSRAANIPTGWEVVLDLIRKLAALSTAEPGEDPAEWYQKQFGEPPDYARLLQRLAATPAERTALLKSYFEPADEDRDVGRKVPTRSHQAIAGLVKDGYVRMILTTNFDRLIEEALAQEGIVPDVISTADAICGAMPYMHSKCTVVKLHGDYRDLRIKNTPVELATYDPGTDTYLDRVLDDFGLIVSGWSGEWDTALRQAILRGPNRRFTTFWLARGGVVPAAQELIDARRAVVVPITSAEDAFPRLLEQVLSLAELGKSNPLSVAEAVATIKRYLPDERHRIRLHDLVHQEVGRVRTEMESDKFSLRRPAPDPESFRERVRRYEMLVLRLMSMLATIAYHEKEGGNAYLITDALVRIGQSGELTGDPTWYRLWHYPLRLAVYATGLAALAGGRWDNLAAVLLRPKFRTGGSRLRPSIVERIAEVFRGEMAKALPYDGAANAILPANDYMYLRLRPELLDYIPDDEEYERLFDVFEYLVSLLYWEECGAKRAPLGRFAWRHWQCGSAQTPMDEFVRQSGQNAAEGRQGLLAVGFFGGTAQRLVEASAAHDAWGKELAARWR